MMRAWRRAGAAPPGSALPAGDDPDAVHLTEQQAPDLEPGDDEVVLGVEACVFGGPELRSLEHNPQLTPGGAAVGTVLRAGRNATDAVGVRAVIGSIHPCGECDVCARGAAPHCQNAMVLGDNAHGALADQVRVPARWLCRLDEGLDVPGPEAALLGREAAVAYALYTTLGAAPGDPVIVVGSGAIARLLIDIAVAKGTRPLALVLGQSAWRAAVAERGATCIDLQGAMSEGLDQVRARVRTAAAAAGLGTKPWLVFETTGHDAGRRLALALASPAARLALVAPWTTGAPAAGAIELDEVLANGVTIATVRAAHPDLVPELAALATRGELDLRGAAELIGPDDLDDATRALRRDSSSTVYVTSIR